MKKITARHARRGGTLVIGVPRLQDTFDALRKGEGLVLQQFGDPMPGGITQVLLVSEDRLAEILHELQDESRESNPNLN